MDEPRGTEERVRVGWTGRRWCRDRKMVVVVVVALGAVGAAVGLGADDDRDRAAVDTQEPDLRHARTLLGTSELAPPAAIDAGSADADATETNPPEPTSPVRPSREDARTAGILTVLSDFGADVALGNEPMSALGALTGDQIGTSFGFGGLGVVGSGRGGGAPAPSPFASLDSDREHYEPIDENGFVPTADHPRSTFATDVDSAAYSNVRRFLRDGVRPPPDAVRVEEMINYFEYDYPLPTGTHPLAVYTEVATCPWAPEHRLLHIGIRTRRIDDRRVPPRNLVFLVDVSGSMDASDKLGLLVRAMGLLVDGLRPEDRVAIVVYAGAAGLVLPPTSGSRPGEIRAALARLHAGGSTNGGDGIRLAYSIARRSFVDGGINRVVLATDGDFNVGTTGPEELTRLIERQRRSGVFLTVLGFGRGNLGDHTMETLADRGNGNYAYIDDLIEARRVLVREAGATLVTVAQDVKLQLELNPGRVAAYRLVGYENRRLRDEEFDDDTRDAGEIGAGHTVTALYEIVPTGPEGADAEELALVKVRYQPPGGGASALLTHAVLDSAAPWRTASESYRFAAAVASFGMLLRRSENRGSASWASTLTLARGAVGADPHGERDELITLIERARRL